MNRRLETAVERSARIRADVAFAQHEARQTRKIVTALIFGALIGVALVTVVALRAVETCTRNTLRGTSAAPIILTLKRGA